MVRLSATNYKTGESVDLGWYRNYKCAAEAILEEVVFDEDDIPGHWHFDISVDDGRTGLAEVPVFGVMCTLDDFMNEPEEDEDEEWDFEDDVDETNYDPYMGCDFWDDGSSFEGWD